MHSAQIPLKGIYVTDNSHFYVNYEIFIHNEDDYIDVGDNDDNVNVSGPQHRRMVSVTIAYW